MSEKTVTLPDREIYLANAILYTLRSWHRDAQKGNPNVPWYVTAQDLDQLEAWADNLWNAYQSTVDHLTGQGFTIITQPSKVGSEPCGAYNTSQVVLRYPTAPSTLPSEPSPNDGLMPSGGMTQTMKTPESLNVSTFGQIDSPR